MDRRTSDTTHFQRLTDSREMTSTHASMCIDVSVPQKSQADVHEGKWHSRPVEPGQAFESVTLVRRESYGNRSVVCQIARLECDVTTPAHHFRTDRSPCLIRVPGDETVL